MSDTCDVPLLEVLDSVPLNGRSMWEVSTHEHRNIPYGNICQQAAMRIRQLERELAEAKDWKSIKVTKGGETHPLGTLLEMLERELAAHKAQHVRDEADYNELEADYRDSIAKHVECVEKLEAIIDAHKAVLTKSYNTLEEIVSSPFYQRTCRGGEMERLMNQAIKHLTSVNPNQASQ